MSLPREEPGVRRGAPERPRLVLFTTAPTPRWIAAAASLALPLGGDGAGAGPAGPGSEAAEMPAEEPAAERPGRRGPGELSRRAPRPALPSAQQRHRRAAGRGCRRRPCRVPLSRRGRAAGGCVSLRGRRRSVAVNHPLLPVTRAGRSAGMGT